MGSVGLIAKPKGVNALNGLIPFLLAKGLKKWKIFYSGVNALNGLIPFLPSHKRHCLIQEGGVSMP